MTLLLEQFLLAASNSGRKNKTRPLNVPDPSPPSTQMTVVWGMVWLARLGTRWLPGKIIKLEGNTMVEIELDDGRIWHHHMDHIIRTTITIDEDRI